MDDLQSLETTGRGRNRQTWFKITNAGRSAVHDHVAALNALVDSAPAAPDMVEG